MSARDLAKCAREVQHHAIEGRHPGLERYAQGVGDVMYQVLGDEGLVQAEGMMALIVQRYHDLGNL